MTEVKVNAAVSGRFKFEAFKADKNGNEIEGTRRVLADWFDNLITNNGLNLIGSSVSGGYLLYCQVGSGSTAPANGDTALVSRISGTNTSTSTSSGNQSTEPYFCWRRRTYRFSAGQAAGNISEVGVGPATTGNLFSRALILDGDGDPTTITVLSDEVLDVTYELRVYPPTVDWEDTVSISGVSYDLIGRASEVTTGHWNISAGGSAMTASVPTAYNGTIGSITGSPSGSFSAGTSVSTQSYSSGTHQKDAIGSWGLSNGNLAGGITAIDIAFGFGMYQFGIDPAIPKTSSTVLDLTFRISWARKTL